MATPIRLKDVLFMCHAKPKDEAQAALWKRLIDNDLTISDTWEVNLSAGADKKATFERLMAEKKLGAMAFLRNLRNMREAKVDERLMEAYASTVKTDKVLPFRYISAARHNPTLEPLLDSMLMRTLAGKPKIMGRTVVLVDVSGSMDASTSSKSEIMRVDAACGLAILLRELCEKTTIYSFSDRLQMIPPRQGFALRDAILHSQPHSGTNLGGAVGWVNMNDPQYDRIIVITDEQSWNPVPSPLSKKAYIINVASEKNGIGYSVWSHINGFSASTIEWLQAYEAEFMF